MLLPLSKVKKLPDLDAVPTVFSKSRWIFLCICPVCHQCGVQAELSVGGCVSILQRMYLLLFALDFVHNSVSCCPSSENGQNGELMILCSQKGWRNALRGGGHFFNEGELV